MFVVAFFVAQLFTSCHDRESHLYQLWHRDRRQISAQGTYLIFCTFITTNDSFRQVTYHITKLFSYGTLGFPRVGYLITSLTFLDRKLYLCVYKKKKKILDS